MQIFDFLKICQKVVISEIFEHFNHHGLHIISWCRCKKCLYLYAVHIHAPSTSVHSPLRVNASWNFDIFSVKMQLDSIVYGRKNICYHHAFCKNVFLRCLCVFYGSVHEMHLHLNSLGIQIFVFNSKNQSSKCTSARNCSPFG